MQCGAETTTIDGDTLVIKLDFKAKKSNVHEIGLINGIKVLSLDCKEVMGEIGKVIRHNDRLYIMDKQTFSVFIFDTTGVYINHISRKGQGPEEYLFLTDIFVDPYDVTLNLICQNGGKILKFDSDGNNLVEVVKTPKRFTNISTTKDGYIGYMRNYIGDDVKPYNVWTITPEMEPGESFFEIDRSWSSIGLGSGTVFSIFGDFIHYITPMDFNIYAFRNGTLSIPYRFDLGDLTWPQDKKDFAEYEKWRLDFELKNRYIMRFHNFQETENHLITRVISEGQSLLGVYDKRNKKTHIAELMSSYSEYPITFGQIISFDETAIYTYISASTMKHFWIGEYIEDRYPEQLKRLRERFPEIDEEDNPFLVIYTIN